MIFKLPIDPIDENLIINEMALNISAQYTKIINFTNLIDLNKFK